MSNADTEQQRRNRQAKNSQPGTWNNEDTQPQDQPQQGGTMGQTYTGNQNQNTRTPANRPSNQSQMPPTGSPEDAQSETDYSDMGAGQGDPKGQQQRKNPNPNEE